MNHADLIGRTTDNIELRYTSQTQTAVGTFTLAVQRQKKEDGADFIRCKVWGKRAEIMEKYVKKGHKVGISGRIETGSYKNREGVTVYTTEVVVEDFDFLEPRHDQGNPTQSNTQPTQSNTQPTGQQQSLNDLPDGYAYTDDDLPY